VGNDGSTFLWLTYFRATTTGVSAEWVWFGIGIATIGLLMYGAGYTLWGSFKGFFSKEERKAQRQILKAGDKIRYR
jgi:hypothetical protein